MATKRTSDELTDPLEGQLGYLLRRTALATMATLEAAYAPLGLRLTDAVILRFIGANPGCNQAAISRALGVTRTNMVPFVSSLVAKNLVDREASDGRSHALLLTAKGEALADRLVQLAADHEDWLFGAFDAATRETLRSALRQVRALAVSAGEVEAEQEAK